MDGTEGQKTGTLRDLILEYVNLVTGTETEEELREDLLAMVRQADENEERRVGMSAVEAVRVLRETARDIPTGGTIRIRGDAPISAYNFAEACARIIEDIASDRDVYHRLCSEPRRMEQEK